MHPALRRPMLGAAGIALAAITGCAAPGPGSPQLPCRGNPASHTELGLSILGTTNTKQASFTTTGGTIYLHPHDFTGSEFLPPPKGSQVTTYIGPADTPPHVDNQDKITTPVSAKISAGEGKYQSFNLPAGRYWLMTVSPVRVELLSCTPDALTGTPIPRNSTPAASPSHPTPSTRPS